MNPNRQKMLDLIRSNIERSGRHLYAISGGESPQFLYTIGLSQKVDFELVFAGGAAIETQELGRVLNSIAEELEKEPKKTRFTIPELGEFHLAPVHQSWVKELLLGALDYYDVSEIEARQVVPESELRTIDVPELKKTYCSEDHPVWRWLKDEAPHPNLNNQAVITNLDALKGYMISELLRYGEHQWEMFSGPESEVAAEEMFRVPLATLLAFDTSLEEALGIPVGTGLFREFSEDGQPGQWQSWKPAE